MVCTRTAVSASPVPRPLGCWPGLRIVRRYLLPPPPNSCSWVRDAVVLPITVVLLSCVGGRAFMIAPNRDNGNGFRASDCKIAEYNIFSTLLYFTLLYSILSHGFCFLQITPYINKTTINIYCCFWQYNLVISFMTIFLKHSISFMDNIVDTIFDSL